MMKSMIERIIAVMLTVVFGVVANPECEKAAEIGMLGKEDPGIRRDVGEPSKIVFIGDSLTQGSLGDDNGNQNNPWAPYRILQSQLAIPVEGYGYYGYSAHDCLWSYTAPQHDNQQKDPSALYILWVGSNDFRDARAGAVDGVIAEMTDFLVSGEIGRYLIVGTTDREEIRYTGDYKVINQKLEEYYGDRFIDIMPYREFGPDNLHLTKESYENIGDAIRAKLVQMGEMNGDPKPADPAKRYSDVGNEFWYGGKTGPVAFVSANAIMSGTGNGETFEPDGECTRAMFVQILYNMQQDHTQTYVTPFKDVVPGRWYESAAGWAYSNGITSGTTPVTFEPDTVVSRESVARFLYNYAGKCGHNITDRGDLSVYADAYDISGWAADAVSWATANGIINGYSNGKLGPKDVCTRAQIAQMITKYVKRFGR